MTLFTHWRTFVSHLIGEIDIMEARGNGPSYPKQYVRTSIFTRTFYWRALQRFRLRPRVVKLGSTYMAERRFENVWMVALATWHLWPGLPWLCSWMGQGFHVKPAFHSVISARLTSPFYRTGASTSIHAYINSWIWDSTFHSSSVVNFLL